MNMSVSLKLYLIIQLIQLSMRGNSRINRQQQVKVVIRLKPDQSQNRFAKCVYLSDQDQNQLVVETDGKKEIFMFDHVAHQLTSQVEIYRMIGQQCVQQAFQGYNCCIFAYGQTGAGKTYSVLGNLGHIYNDIYCESRGILPRLLEDVFQAMSTVEGQKQSVVCSYMEIYNQQIFDLLSADKRIHQIRQDAKKGVFIEGLIETRLTSYKNAVAILLEGEKTRKMATTLMNTESSRSHAIFSIMIESKIVEEDVIKIKKAKLHIVDLAGSERVKHTNVEGERLREGCNINKSLHVLGNVINSLVESTKKKKHIPFRDSKLTHYLKDSLGGNSITKLLANVHTNKLYYGDTLSTLMFAKRAKILKMKVELNETTGQNFDQLRKEVRQLREELAQARYFKSQGRMSERTTLEPQVEVIFDREHTDSDHSSKFETLKVLQQNQLHYKALIEIYEEHMKICLTSSNIQRKQNINIVKEWKNLEKRNIALTHFLKQLPSFTKIYKENLLLRQERNRMLEGVASDEEVIKSNQFIKEKIQQIQNSKDGQELSSLYEQIIDQMEKKFRECLQILEKNYLQLQNQCKLKDKKIKDLKKKKEYPPQIEELKEENQYLHLIILKLQNQIAKLNQNQEKIKLELKESKKNTAKKVESKQDLSDNSSDDQVITVYQKLHQIKKQAERQAEINQNQKNQMQTMISRLQTEIAKLVIQNNKLTNKYTKSKSRHKSSHKEQYHSHSQIENKTSFISNNQQKDKPIEDMALSMKVIGHTDQEFKSLHQNYSKEILVLKMDVKRKQKEIIDLKKDLEEYMNQDKKIEDQFGKTLEQIVEAYRESNKKTLQQSKSAKIIHKVKQVEPTVQKINSRPQEKEQKQKHTIETKQIPRGRELVKKEDPKVSRRLNTLGFK